MVDCCANPKCGKPLYYLREGRIFVFDVPQESADGRVVGARARRMEHYWLCGSCSVSMVLKHSVDEGVKLLSRVPGRLRPMKPVGGVPIAALLAGNRMAS